MVIARQTCCKALTALHSAAAALDELPAEMSSLGMSAPSVWLQPPSQPAPVNGHPAASGTPDVAMASAYATSSSISKYNTGTVRQHSEALSTVPEPLQPLLDHGNSPPQRNAFAGGVIATPVAKDLHPSMTQAAFMTQVGVSKMQQMALAEASAEANTSRLIPQRHGDSSTAVML